MANLILSPVKIDILFGLSHTILSLGITMIFARFINNKLALMFVNSIVFSFNMFIISYMLKVFAEFDLSFLFIDWKSTRLNSSHVAMSYAVFCLQKKTIRAYACH